MSAKKKKQSNSPLRVIIILVLLGLLAYKHQLFDGKLLENIPTIESNEEKPEILTSPQHGGALEIPMIQSSTGGQIRILRTNVAHIKRFFHGLFVPFHIGGRGHVSPVVS